MKLRTATKLALALAAMTTLVSCGDDNDDNSSNPVLGTAKSFQGNWQFARLDNGKTEPEAIGCLAGAENTGLQGLLSIASLKAKSTIKEYVNDPKCEGKNLLTIDLHVVFAERLSSKGGVQTFKTGTQAYTVKVEGAETVAMLNQREVCGHTDWQAKTYTQLDQQLKDCTPENTERTSIPAPKDIEESKHMISQFKMQGKGLAISSRDSREKDSKFGEPIYYVKN